MTFIDLEFLIFLLSGIIVFYICPVKYRWIALLGISTVFYAIAGLEYLPFIFVTSLSVWLGGKKMGALYDKQNLELENKELTKRFNELEQYFINYCKDNEKDKQQIYEAIDLLMDRTKPTKIGFVKEK